MIWLLNLLSQKNVNKLKYHIDFVRILEQGMKSKNLTINLERAKLIISLFLKEMDVEKWKELLNETILKEPIENDELYVLFNTGIKKSEC